MKKPNLFYSIKLKKFFEVTEFIPDFKDFLQDEFGQNVPSSVMKSKSNVLCDRNILSYYTEFSNDEYGSIAHHCVHHYGVFGSIYNWDTLINAISKLTFVKVKQAVTWGSKKHDTFFVINRKRLKKWFKQNHNRFLIPKNTNRNWLRQSGLRTEDFFDNCKAILIVEKHHGK